jgi:hypothetical protein
MGDADERREQLQATTWALFTLCINLGLIESVIDQYPEHVQHNFTERLTITQEWAERMIEEAQAFGEAYDEETEETDPDPS